MWKFQRVVNPKKLNLAIYFPPRCLSGMVYDPPHTVLFSPLGIWLIYIGMRTNAVIPSVTGRRDGLIPRLEVFSPFPFLLPSFLSGCIGNWMPSSRTTLRTAERCAVPPRWFGHRPAFFKTLGSFTNKN